MKKEIQQQDNKLKKLPKWFWWVFWVSNVANVFIIFVFYAIYADIVWGKIAVEKMLIEVCTGNTCYEHGRNAGSETMRFVSNFISFIDILVLITAMVTVFVMMKHLSEKIKRSDSIFTKIKKIAIILLLSTPTILAILVFLYVLESYIGFQIYKL